MGFVMSNMVTLNNRHFGPRWYWDQSRPEAIEARSQVAEFHKRCLVLPLSRQAKTEQRETARSLLAKHFQLAGRRLGRVLVLVSKGLRTWPNRDALFR